tara:strand:+ start:14406 stop:15002 length:597 start_codon:yes stop_codon:yes gene_type:complete
MIIQKKEKEVWYGSHKGVNFEINRWNTAPNTFQPEGNENWTYYLTLEIDKIPKEHNPKSYWLKPNKSERFRNISYEYYNHPVMPNLDWHGGQTWYEKKSGIDGQPKVIQIGCDYQHSWDQGMTFTLEGLQNDVANTINAFLNLVPNYKYRCCGNGKLYDLSEGLVTEGGRFASTEYWQDKEWFKNLSDERSKRNKQEN